MNYQINSTVGLGSYGVLYLATSFQTGKEVVIKQLRKRKHTNEGMESFEREALLLQQLSHPAIPKYVDYLVFQNKPYLVMSKMKGVSLDQLIFQQKRVFSKRESFQFCEDLLKVVQYLHHFGIVHRDLRPPNILLDNNDIAVIDFGLAQFMKRENKESPDSLMRECHPRSDFYAIGHTLLFVLYSGYTPSARKKKSWEEELEDLTTEEIRFIRKLLQIEAPFENVSQVLSSLRSILQKL
ncbi:serine/threonine protein kinase [Fredinandcohnia humi]